MTESKRIILHYLYLFLIITSVLCTYLTNFTYDDFVRQGYFDKSCSIVFLFVGLFLEDFGAPADHV